MLVVALLLAPAGASGAPSDVGTAVAWGCDGTGAAPCFAGTQGFGLIDVAASASDSIGLNAGGTLMLLSCAVDYGQCLPPDSPSGITSIAAGDGHTLALKNDGTVLAWGCGGPYARGQCMVPSGLAGVVAIAAGTSQSLALKNDGTVVAWGCAGDDFGQCSVPSGLSSVTAIAAGDT